MAHTESLPGKLEYPFASPANPAWRQAWRDGYLDAFLASRSSIQLTSPEPMVRSGYSAGQHDYQNRALFWTRAERLASEQPPG